MRVSLVPAYSECTLPNREHGPPLAHPSCNPPDQSSGQVTVGTPEENDTFLAALREAVEEVRVA